MPSTRIWLETLRLNFHNPDRFPAIVTTTLGATVDQTLEAFVADVSRARSLDECLDILADRVATLGLPRVLYTYTPAPKASDGTLRAPPLRCRNFPHGWERRWPEVKAHDPYYRACFDGHLIIDWTWLRREGRITAAERQVCTYMDLSLIHI